MLVSLIITVTLDLMKRKHSSILCREKGERREWIKRESTGIQRGQRGEDFSVTFLRDLFSCFPLFRGPKLKLANANT